MAKGARQVPEGDHTATPYIIVKGEAAAIDLYKQAFGAVELRRQARDAGATIDFEPEDRPWGHRIYTARDPERH